MPRVLIVEDDRLVFEALQSAFLMRADFEVDYAADGEAGLSALALRHLDLALIDYGLPKVSGLVVAQHALTRSIPVVLMTGYGDEILDPEEHPFPLLTKPFRVAELVVRFEQVMVEARRLNAIARQQFERSLALRARARTRRECFSDEWLRICGQLATRQDRSP